MMLDTCTLQDHALCQEWPNAATAYSCPLSPLDYNKHQHVLASNTKCLPNSAMTHSRTLLSACCFNPDLVGCQLVIKATPAQLLLLLGKHSGSLLLGLGLLLGHIVSALLLKLGPLDMYHLAGVFSEGRPIKYVQRQLDLHMAEVAVL